MKWRLENGYSAIYVQLALVGKVSGFQENKIEKFPVNPMRVLTPRVRRSDQPITKFLNPWTAHMWEISKDLR